MYPENTVNTAEKAKNESRGHAQQRTSTEEIKKNSKYSKKIIQAAS